MTIRLFKIFMLAAPLVLSLLTSAPQVDAQQPCQIGDVSFRTTKSPATDNDFYEQDDRPYVYIDVTTLNCLTPNQTLKFSLIGGTLDYSLAVDAMTDLPVIIGSGTMNSPGFTMVMRAGEENCDGMDYDCEYELEVKNASNTVIYTYDNNFSYDCDGLCENFGEDWEFIDIIPWQNDYGMDPYANEDNQDGNTDVGPPPQQADDPNGESFIDLSIPNPVAGTIDNIPGLFQKIVDFAITIGIPLVAMAIVYSGFLFVTARGDSGQIDTAKSAFTAAVIGGLVLFAAWLVAAAIKDALLSI